MAASATSYLMRGFVIGTISTATISSIWTRWSTQKPIDIEYQEGVQKQMPQDYLTRAADILKHGAPDGGTQLRFYKNHVLVYDQAKKIPIWVAEHLTKENIKGDANRKNSYFTLDPTIDEAFRADNQDFLGSGWSRGHMAPAGDNKKDQVAMNDTFLLSNILPQDFDNNSGFWNRFEMYCRQLTKTYENVYVMSGPLFLSQAEEGKRYVKYQVIGKNEVAVPTHLYKVLVADNGEGNMDVGAFIVPNKAIDSTHKLTEFQVPLRHLEAKSGIKFVRDLYQKHGDLCSVHGCKLTEQKDSDIYFLKRELSNVKSTESLQRVWRKVEGKNLQREKVLKDLYNEKQKMVASGKLR